VQKLRNAFRLLRVMLWWNHIIAPLAGVFYGLLLLGQPQEEFPWLPLGCFLLSVIGTASLGYWINDWTDREQDQRVGKSNATIGFSRTQMWGILFLFFLIATLPWYFLPRHFLSFGLWIMLVVALIMYSVPPFRFKEKSILGAICDVAYGHLLPVWITIGTFAPLLEVRMTAAATLSWGLSLVFFTKGLRNIIQHQLADRKKDQQLRLNTFVRWLGPYRSAIFISVCLLPLELLLLGMVLFIFHPGVFFIFSLFILTYGLRIWSWKFYRARSIRRIFRLWFVLNDYYEATFPLSILIFLIFRSPLFLLLLMLHLLIFPKTLDHWKWVWKTWINLELWRELRKYIL